MTQKNVFIGPRCSCHLFTCGGIGIHHKFTMIFFFHGGVHCTQTKWYTQFNKWFCTLYLPPVLWIPLDTVLVFQRDNYYAFHSPEIEFTGRCTEPTSNTNHYFLLFIYIIQTQHSIYFKLNYYNKKLSLLL